MKDEVSKPLIFGVIAIVIIVVAVIGWKVLGPAGGPSANTQSGSASSREQHFKDHPGDKAVFDSMNKGAAPPGGGAGAPAGSAGR